MQWTIQHLSLFILNERSNLYAEARVNQIYNSPIPGAIRNAWHTVTHYFFFASNQCNYIASDNTYTGNGWCIWRILFDIIILCHLFTTRYVEHYFYKTHTICLILLSITKIRYCIIRWQAQIFILKKYKFCKGHCQCALWNELSHVRKVWTRYINCDSLEICFQN